MAPTIAPGDLIFLDISINQFDGDGIYVFGFDDKIYVKRLQMTPDKLLLISDNTNYRECTITKHNQCRFGVSGKALISQTPSLKRHN
ncbi:S24 family peptidase, partial [Salmonella enterica]|uniref:S24 family peptidase n=1 Tax=Salmonella enterica TaxID=28901 RepID=UPI0016546468